MDGVNWHHGGRCINRYATAVEVVQVDHSVDARVFRQQVVFDNFNHVVHNVCHAVHAGGNTQQVFGAHAAVGVAVTFKGVIFQRRRFRQRDRGFVDPAAFGDIAYRVTDNFAIANDFTILRNGCYPFSGVFVIPFVSPVPDVYIVLCRCLRAFLQVCTDLTNKT